MQPVRTRRGGISLNVGPPRWSCAAEVARWVPLAASLSEKSPRVGGSVRKITRRCVNDHVLCGGLHSLPASRSTRPRSPQRSGREAGVNGPLQQRHARLVGMTCALRHSTIDDSSASTECVERKALSSPAVAVAAAEKKHDQDDDENPSPDRHRLFLLSSARVARAVAHLDANIRLVPRNAYRRHGEHPATPMNG